MPHIFNLLFEQHKIFEILIFRLIIELGFPSIMNVCYIEYEIDIITLVDDIGRGVQGLRLIEVTTRKNLQDKLFRLEKLIDALQKNEFNNIRPLVISFKGRQEDINKNSVNIPVISFDELIVDHHYDPYKLITILLNPEIIQK